MANVREFTPLTGEAGQPRDFDFGDPSPPDFLEAGVVRVYTTGGEILVWRDQKNISAKKAFLAGRPAKHERLALFHKHGKTPLDAEKFGEDAWDPTVEVVDGKRILYAGVMTPTDQRKNGLWPDDHWNRRTYAFTERSVNSESGSEWVMQPESIFGPVPENPTWLGHNYGHAFIANDDGQKFMFYERVSHEQDGQPWLTEIFARRMDSPFALTGPEIPILKLPKRIWPAARRDFGGALVEGPRPFRVGDVYFVGFSAGDYMSDAYGIHLLWSKKIEGPYKAFLTADGRDLKDFGAEIENDFDLTWGAARPSFFEVDGKWWVLFHGVLKTEAVLMRDVKRNIYLAPVRIESPAGDGEPSLRILRRD